jgi:transposase InsO family protein
LLKVGLDVCQATVAKYMVRHRHPPSQTWRTFLANHIGQIMAADFFVVPTATCRLLFVLIIIAHERRRVAHVAVTDHPTAAWTSPQLREAFPWEDAPRYLLRDHDHALNGWAETAKTMRIDELLTAPRSPWQNAYAERFIGSARRECLDHVIVFSAIGTSAVDEALLRLLRAVPHASVAEQGRARPSADRRAGGWPRRSDPAGRRASSPVRTPGRLTRRSSRSQPPTRRSPRIALGPVAFLTTEPAPLHSIEPHAASNAIGSSEFD